MTTVMKVQLNMKLNPEFNASVSFKHIVSNRQDAEDLGAEDSKLFEAYMKGYGDSLNGA